MQLQIRVLTCTLYTCCTDVRTTYFRFVDKSNFEYINTLESKTYCWDSQNISIKYKIHAYTMNNIITIDLLHLLRQLILKHFSLMLHCFRQLFVCCLWHLNNQAKGWIGGTNHMHYNILLFNMCTSLISNFNCIAFNMEIIAFCLYCLEKRNNSIGYRND